MNIDAMAPTKPNRPRATFGLIISANYENEGDLGARIAEHREQVGLARQAGFTSVVCNQHFLMHPVSSLATIPYLTSVIDVSGDMKLAIGVALLPLLSPVLLAEEVATLDWLSGGRAIKRAGCTSILPEASERRRRRRRDRALAHSGRDRAAHRGPGATGARVARSGRVPRAPTGDAGCRADVPPELAPCGRRAAVPGQHRCS